MFNIQYDFSFTVRLGWWPKICNYACICISNLGIYLSRPTLYFLFTIPCKMAKIAF